MEESGCSRSFSKWCTDQVDLSLSSLLQPQRIGDGGAQQEGGLGAFPLPLLGLEDHTMVGPDAGKGSGWDTAPIDEVVL